MMHKVILIFLLAAISNIALGGEIISGRYIYGGGVGGIECPKYVEIMEDAKKNKEGSVEYANKTQGFIMYLFGFQTAYNLQAPDTCDIFNDVSGDQLLAWTENYCQAYPLKKFSSAAVALAQELYPKRLKNCK